MRRVCLMFFLILCSCCSSFSQEYKKDIRSQEKKEDIFSSYKADIITKYEILKALELVGVKIHKLVLPKFEKKQSILITIDEYVDGKVISSQKIFDGNNTYVYFTDSIPTDNTIPYIDYLDQIVFYSKEDNDGVLFIASTYRGEHRRTLNKRILRERQFYNWRSYGQIVWEDRTNEKKPLFIFASSWEENDGNVERFCGVPDLSFDQKATQELLNSSPHYFLISGTISE